MNDGLKNGGLNLFPSNGQIPQEGTPKIKQAIEYRKYRERMKLTRVAPILAEPKKAVKTKSIPLSRAVAISVAGIALLVGLTMEILTHNQAGADIYWKKLNDMGYNVDRVEWGDGYIPIDKSGHRVYISDEDSRDAYPSEEEIIHEQFHNEIHQGGRGK